jgi:hypothetical protein
MLRWLLLLCGVAAAAPEIRENERFRLEAAATAEESDEMMRLLEAAYAHLAARFKAKPGKISVTLSEGAPGAADPKAVAIQRQPGRYATRALLLREYVRVFYELARAKGREAETKWYREGQAEFLAGHDWDGRTLRMGIVPQVAPENLPGEALAEARREDFDIGAYIDGKAQSRALSSALYGYVATGDGGKPLPGFDKFEPKMAGGVKAAPLFWQCFGKKPPEHRDLFIKWLESAQLPFVPISGDWEGLAPGRIRGGGKGLAACRFQVAASEFHATVGARDRKGWRAGVVLSHASDKEYAVFLADWAGYFYIFKVVDGKRQTLEQGEGMPPSADGSYRIQLFRKKELVYLMLEGGASYGPWELPGTGFGLVVENNDFVFTDVSWK